MREGDPWDVTAEPIGATARLARLFQHMAGNRAGWKCAQVTDTVRSGRRTRWIIATQTSVRSVDIHVGRPIRRKTALFPCPNVLPKTNELQVHVADFVRRRIRTGAKILSPGSHWQANGGHAASVKNHACQDRARLRVQR